MALIENVRPHIEQAERDMAAVRDMKRDPLVWDAFYKCFEYRFCWSSNSLEGNTLSLNETIALVDFDEVSSGHTFSEYLDAKNLFRAIRETLSVKPVAITGEWIQKVNGTICGTDGRYRDHDVFIGSAVETVFYPPKFADVPERMRAFIREAQNVRAGGFADTISDIAENHIRFERIHPFRDGNGRTGRLIVNQMLLNSGLLPATVSHTSKYRQAFRAYDRNRDTSMLVYLLCDALSESARSLTECSKRRDADYYVNDKTRETE